MRARHGLSGASRGGAVLFALASSLLVASCGDPNPPFGDCRDAGRCDASAFDGARPDGTPAPDARDLDVPPVMGSWVSIDITPHDPVLDAVDSTHPMQQFTAVGVRRDGTTEPLSGGQWTLDATLIGGIDATTGMFTGTGAGGVSHVHVALPGTGLTASTSVTVRVLRRVLGMGVPTTAPTMFTGPPSAADGPPLVDYPLEGAVMPRNVHAPRLMWTPQHTGAGPTDLYRVLLERTHARVEGYFTTASNPELAFQVPDDVFAALANSDVGDPIRVTVSVLAGGVVRTSAPRSFRTVDAVIGGAVYYWSPPTSRLMRIDVTDGRRVDFMPQPPDRACIGCHTLSRDGHRLVTVIYFGSATNSARLGAFDVTRDLTGPNPPRLFETVPALDTTRGAASTDQPTASFSPDNSRLVAARTGGGPLYLINGTDGSAVPGATLMVNAVYPEWSPDGHTVAYQSQAPSGIYTVPIMGDRFGAQSMLTNEGAFPTWTPNSQWIAYSTYFTSNEDLRLVAATGGAPITLARANGPGIDHRPVFSPFNSGGYFWVLFTSDRSYGNATGGVRMHKQIWVAAVSNHPMSGADPSEVPYYLDGQEPVTNLAPYWSPPPCRDNGMGCATGSDCCSGTCEPDTGGNPVCRPRRGSCAQRGQGCSVDADCCTDAPGGRLVCGAGRLCDYPPPG